MSALPALALAAALTYVIGDFFRPHVPTLVVIVIDLVIFIALYKLTKKYLEHLKG